MAVKVNLEATCNRSTVTLKAFVNTRGRKTETMQCLKGKKKSCNSGGRGGTDSSMRTTLSW